MKICVIHPKICTKSAKELASVLGAVAINPYKQNHKYYGDYDLVFNYGCQLNVLAKKFVNKPSSVAKCIDKLSTFYKLMKMGLPIVPFTEHVVEVPKHWKTVVCRKVVDGHQSKGLSYVQQGDALPVAQLYTDFYEHKHEFRIIVFKNKVVGRYLKVENKKGEWIFEHLQPTGFKAMDASCELASKMLDIDFVGFDVLANTQTDFRILEANSGPILSPEIADIIKDSIHV